MYIADLHLHSDFSDGSFSIPTVVDIMGRAGIGAICITDHLCEQKTFLGKAAKYLEKTLTPQSFPHYMNTIRSEAQRAWRQYKMLVIPGVEITKNSFSHRDSAHILAINVHDYIDPDMPLKDVIAAIHAQGGLAIAAHPVHTGKKEHQTRLLWNQRDELRHLFDAWEVASGRLMFPEVQASGLPMIANSDFHHLPHLESWKTLLNTEKTVDALKNAIRRQSLTFQYFSPSPQPQSSWHLKNLYST